MEQHIPMPQQPRVADSKLELDWQFQGFAILWALASLWVVWQRIEMGFADPSYWAFNGVLSVAAFVILVRPRWTVSVAILGVTHTVYALFQMPHVQSHEMLLAFFGLAITISYLSGAAVHRRYDVSGIGLYRSCVPVLRMMVVLSLLAIGLSRLNWAFIDLGSSPVVDTLMQIRGTVVPDWISYFTISLLMIVDAFLAIALLVPSLRRFAVGFGSCYICWQGWMGFGEAWFLLPVFLLGLYLFTSTESVARFHGMLQRNVPFPVLRRRGLSVYVAVVAMTAWAVWYQQHATGQLTWLTSDRLVMGGFIGLIGGWLFLLLSNLVDLRPRLTWISFAPRNVAHYLLLAVFVAYGASPYLGLGNVGRLTSGSGLASAWQRNNHLFVPQSSVTEYEQDWVAILQSDDPYLASLAEDRMRITWFDMVNYLQPRDETMVEFDRDGQRYRVDRAGDIEEFSQPNSWLPRKMTAFNAVSAEAFSRLSGDKTVARP